jgi:hypothetical protein
VSAGPSEISSDDARRPIEAGAVDVTNWNASLLDRDGHRFQKN